MHFYGTILVQSLLVISVNADFIFEARVHSYRNPAHALFDERCCETGFHPNCDIDTCDTAFVFCLREYNADGIDELIPTETREQNCPYGFYMSDVFVDQDSVNFDEEHRLPNLTFQGTIWPGRAQFFTRVIAKDHGNAGVASFHINQVLSVRSDFSAPMVNVTEALRYEMNVSFRVVCTENFYGPNCSTYCQPQNDTRGRYTCDSEGDIVCLEGFQVPATNCTQCIPAERCSPVGGYCNKPDECICQTGYSGGNCEIDLDRCTHTMPCQNNATCLSTGPDLYECVCEEEYEGVDCELNVTDECDPNPCRNGGMCTDLLLDYMCSCPSGFFGRNCEVSIPAVVAGALAAAGVIIAVLLIVMVVLWKRPRGMLTPAKYQSKEEHEDGHVYDACEFNSHPDGFQPPATKQAYYNVQDYTRAPTQYEEDGEGYVIADNPPSTGPPPPHVDVTGTGAASVLPQAIASDLQSDDGYTAVGEETGVAGVARPAVPSHGSYDDVYTEIDDPTGDLDINGAKASVTGVARPAVPSHGNYDDVYTEIDDPTGDLYINDAEPHNYTALLFGQDSGYYIAPDNIILLSTSTPRQQPPVDDVNTALHSNAMNIPSHGEQPAVGSTRTSILCSTNQAYRIPNILPHDHQT